jgi:predicted enzyme related to lactoylglutathione lyase
LLADLLGTTCSGPLLAAPLRLPVLVDPASHEHHVGKVIFVELVTPDLAAAKRFYAGLFGWTFRDIQTAGGDYAEASLDGRPVAGLFHKDVPTGALRQPAWLSFIAVRDVDAARKIALENGARILVEPHTVSQRWQRWQARGTW